MSKASNVQWSFAGGEWSPEYQGRVDDPAYPTGLNRSLNSFPLEEGAWTRRFGTRRAGYTRNGVPARLLPFTPPNRLAHGLEMTNNVMRIWNGASRLKTKDAATVSSLSTATPALVTTSAVHNWSSGDQVEFDDGDPTLLGRVFAITVTDTDEFTIADAITGESINGTGLTAPTTVRRILEITTGLVDEQNTNMRIIQAGTRPASAVLLNGGQPHLLTAEDDIEDPAGDPLFEFSPLLLEDGPYNELVRGATITLNDLYGVTQASIAFEDYDSSEVYSKGDFVESSSVGYISLIDTNVGNTPASSPTAWEVVTLDRVFGPNGITDGDIGRAVRLHSEPADWAAGTTYAAKAKVKYAGTYWTSLTGSNTGNVPGDNTTSWVLAPLGANRWTWGRIVALGAALNNLQPGVAGIGDFTQNGSARDGTAAQTFANSAYHEYLPSAQTAGDADTTVTGPNTTFSKYVGTNFTGDVAQKIKSVTIYPSTDRSWFQWYPTGTIRARSDRSIFFSWTFNFKLRGKNSAPPSSASDGTELGTYSVTRTMTIAPTGGATYLTVNFGSTPFDIGDGFAAFGGWNIPLPPGPIVINSSDQTTAWDYAWVELQVVHTNVSKGRTNFNNDFMVAISEISFLSPDGTGGFDIEILGRPTLYATSIREWRLGTYADSTVWPSAGTYDEGGRLWLTGAIPNRFDASRSNDPFNFAPTEEDGTVVASNAISYTLNSKNVNDIYWMEPEARGLVCGTKGGEWLIRAGDGGAVSPTNIKADRVTAARCADQEPVRTDNTLLFTQLARDSLQEHFLDVNAAVFTVNNVSKRAHHLVPSIRQLIYTAKPIPIVWARMATGELVGVVYKRVYLSAAREPEMLAWHQHTLPTDYLVSDMATLALDDNPDVLGMIVTDANNKAALEFMMPVRQNAQVWLLDSAREPTATEDMTTFARLYGFHHLEGLEVSVYAGGLDCGDFTVENGYVDVPYGNGVTGGTGSGQFTADFAFPTGGAAPPFILVGVNYTSQGQRLRAVTQSDTGDRLGLLSFGTTRRTHEFAMLLKDTRGLKVGTDFDHMRPIKLVPAGKRDPIGLLELYNGIYQDVLDDDYSMDSMLAWEVDRPYPGTVAAISSFIKTQGR